MPAPKVSGLASPRSAAMSNSPGSPSTPSRLPVNAQTITTVPAGKVTSRYSTSSCSRRAVKGVIGSKRTTSSTAAGASSGFSARSRHWSGWAANSRTAWASCDCVVSTPPTSTFRTRFMHSTSERRSPSCSAAIRVEMRSSAGSARRRSISSPAHS